LFEKPLLNELLVKLESNSIISWLALVFAFVSGYIIGRDIGKAIFLKNLSNFL